ncbi:MAG: AgmX/PglI C-terminal domain-containing protein [Oligoflexia bacterium]|nr:AgmX/PglI C-terminal domain-containing protein [Oligoflexia bacterium]
MQYLSLKIFQDSKLIKTKIFTDDQISIGSSEGLNLQLEGLSPWHALIEKKHDIFCILDLNSETGTRLNGEKITDETPLQSGAVIHIGLYEIHFFIGPPVEKTIKSEEPKPSAPQPTAPIDAQQAPRPVAPKPVVSKPSAPATPVFNERVKAGTPSVSKVKPEVKPEPTATAPTEPEPAPAEPAPSVPTEPEPVTTEPMPSAPPAPEPATVFKQVKKPSKKGFWNTYAPLSRVKNLDDYLEPSIGNLIEVNVCWKERILKSYYFFKSGDVFVGGEKNCQIQFPNMQNQPAYKLLTIATGAQIYLSGAVRGVLFQGKNKSTRVSHALKGNQSVTLKPYEMVRLDFNSDLKLYVRLMDKPPVPPLVGLLNLRVSEALALLFALLLTGLLFFYGALYAPSFLTEDIKFIEKDMRVAQVIFNKKPEKRKVVKYDLKDKTVKAISPKKSKVRKKRAKKTALKAPVKKPVKKIRTPKKGKQGKMSAVAKGRGKPTKKIKAGSSRPGGSIKTGKAGSSAKTVASDPTKVGVLGILGGGGKMDKLDKGASGPGGLVGLADQYTGAAGTADSYGGKGLGTKTKEMASGKGSAIQGISGIKTKGKGLGVSGSGRGGLGERGRMSMAFSTEDIDVSGEIDRGAILRVIKRNQNKFQRCYQLSLNQKASLQGNLTMKWMISGNGKGRNARAVESGIDSRTLKNCVAGVLEGLVFPEPPSGQIPDVKFTFRFYL